MATEVILLLLETPPHLVCIRIAETAYEVKREAHDFTFNLISKTAMPDQIMGFKEAFDETAIFI